MFHHDTDTKSQHSASGDIHHLRYVRSKEGKRGFFHRKPRHSYEYDYPSTLAQQQMETRKNISTAPTRSSTVSSTTVQQPTPTTTTVTTTSTKAPVLPAMQALPNRIGCDYRLIEWKRDYEFDDIEGVNHSDSYGSGEFQGYDDNEEYDYVPRIPMVPGKRLDNYNNSSYGPSHQYSYEDQRFSRDDSYRQQNVYGYNRDDQRYSRGNDYYRQSGVYGSSRDDQRNSRDSEAYRHPSFGHAVNAGYGHNSAYCSSTGHTHPGLGYAHTHPGFGYGHNHNQFGVYGRGRDESYTRDQNHDGYDDYSGRPTTGHRSTGTYLYNRDSDNFYYRTHNNDGYDNTLSHRMGGFTLHDRNGDDYEYPSQRALYGSNSTSKHSQNYNRNHHEYDSQGENAPKRQGVIAKLQDVLAGDKNHDGYNDRTGKVTNVNRDKNHNGYDDYTSKPRPGNEAHTQDVYANTNRY